MIPNFLTFLTATSHLFCWQGMARYRIRVSCLGLIDSSWGKAPKLLRYKPKRSSALGNPSFRSHVASCSIVSGAPGATRMWIRRSQQHGAGDQCFPVVSEIRNGGFHKWGIPKMDGLQFIMENPTKMDDLGVPPFYDPPNGSFRFVMGVPVLNHPSQTILN